MDYTACRDTLWKIKNLPSNDKELSVWLDLALAKAHWLNGEFTSAQSICDLLVEDADTHHRQVVSRTGQAVSRLCAVQDKDDVFSVRDPFRMVFKRLEHTPRDCHTALAAACLNLGVAEAVWAETVRKHNPAAMKDVPLDAAMRMWSQGLMTLQTAEQQQQWPSSSRKPQNQTNGAIAQTVRALLEARLHTCMAWGVMQMPHFEDHMDDASAYAGKALAVYDNNPALQNNGDNNNTNNNASNKEGLAWTLSILATCYHKSGNAVTAEGLLQTALDQPVRSPLQRLERRDVLTRYADLCRDWDKRQTEATQLQQRAEQVDALLPPGWRGKSVIHASLWFWTPALFDY